MEATELWEQALRELQHQMTKATFDSLLAGSYAAGVEDGTLLVAVRSTHALEWLNGRLIPMVGRTVARLDAELAVRFVLNGSHPEEVEAEPEPERGEPLLEAVREERVVVPTGGGPALTWTDFYIKLKVAFRKKALRELQGAPLSVFLCLALHVDKGGVAHPGIELIMRETGYARGSVCRALDVLERLELVSKRAMFHGADEYVVNGYAWFGQQPAPALWEEKS